MVNIPSTIRIAFRAIRVNKMRSSLTMLGIIIGVAAVIAMVAVGAGASSKISEFIASIGSNIIMVLPGATTSGGARMGGGTQSTLTSADAEAIERECSACADVAPVLSGVAQAVFGNQNWSTGVQGTTPSMLTGRDWNISSGRPLTPQDVRSAAKVAILGKTVVDSLFGDADPVGQTIRIKKIPFKVVGVLEPKGQSPSGQDQDDTIFIPLTTAQRKLFGTVVPGQVRIVYVKAKSMQDLAAAERQITDLLRQRHRIGPKQENDFTVRNLTQLLQAQEESARMMTLLLGAIASVSLLVGGIGIMNIMLASVAERTREVGVRRALGARRRDVAAQFLVESSLLTVAGGLLGSVLGLVGSALIQFFAGWPTAVHPLMLVAALVVALAVGIGFGFYPAWHAAGLDPVEALRQE